MKPETHSKTLLGITRSKAKMYEYGIHPDDHIAVPKDPARLFPLALGMLGELAVATNEVELAQLNGSDARLTAKFSAHFIDAYGLENRRMIRVYEAGFTDRVIAKKIGTSLSSIRSPAGIESVLVANEKPIRTILKQYPKYFETVLENIISSAK